MKLSTKTDVDWRVTSAFGVLHAPRNNPHAGTDFGMNNGTPLYAMDDIEVVAVNVGVDYTLTKSGGKWNKDYGNWVMYYVPAYNRTYLDAHLTYGATVPTAGTKMRKGELITKTGNTGLSTGPHLHRSVAVGRYLNLTDLFNNVIDFVKDTVTIEKEHNDFSPFEAKIPANSTLYLEDGTQASLPTTKTHTVTVTSRKGQLLGFSAPWLQGVNYAYFKAADSSTNHPSNSQVDINNKTIYKGKVITIPAKATLRDEKGVAHSLKTTRNHNVTVTGQIDNKDYGYTLLKFSAPWLQGVKSAYIRVKDVKKV